jgi:hypothetical protein
MCGIQNWIYCKKKKRKKKKEKRKKDPSQSRSERNGLTRRSALPHVVLLIFLSRRFFSFRSLPRALHTTSRLTTKETFKLATQDDIRVTADRQRVCIQACPPARRGGHRSSIEQFSLPFLFHFYSSACSSVSAIVWWNCDIGRSLALALS